MKTYWSCSKFADWLRGTKTLAAGTSKEWDAWEKNAKQKKIRFWLAEEGLDYLQNFICWPANRLNDMRCYINNRYFVKSHALTSNLKRGEWCDLDTRLLHSVFDELINFVEIELAWHNYICASDEDRKKYKISWNRKFFRLGTWRCAEAGIDHLNWAAGHKNDEDYIDKNDPEYGKPTSYALGAQEILALYTWWKIDRPKRPDPMDASGWSAYCDEKREEAQRKGEDTFKCMFEDDRDDDRGDAFIKICYEMEQEQDEEDTDMLIRLIKIRHYLWT